MDPEKSTTFRNPRRVKLNIACVYLTNYFLPDDQGGVAATKTALDGHNLQLEVWPPGGGKSSANTLIYPYQEVPHDAYDDAVNRATYKALLNSARDLVKNRVTFSNYLTVVYGQFKHPGKGITPPGMPTTTPLCIISPNPNNDKVDLLHEMGHAADLHHEEGIAKNFMNTANGRSEMMKFQVEKMAKSWYSAF